MEMKFTPGPWIIQDLGARSDYPDWKQYAIRDKKTNVHIATVGHYDRYFEKETGKHAALISAAPDMFEALDDFVNTIERGLTITPTMIIEARNTLNKARGL